jgi:desampylase
MDIRVTRPVLNRMQRDATRAFPYECCGILFGCAGLIEAARPAINVAPDPRHYFEIDPQALIDAYRAERAGGPQVLGYYHSHPGGAAEPSTTDRAQAAHDGRVWAIVGETDVAFWRDGESGFVALSYELEDR